MRLSESRRAGGVLLAGGGGGAGAATGGGVVRVVRVGRGVAGGGAWIVGAALAWRCPGWLRRSPLAARGAESLEILVPHPQVCTSPPYLIIFPTSFQILVICGGMCKNSVRLQCLSFVIYCSSYVVILYPKGPYLDSL